MVAAGVGAAGPGSSQGLGFRVIPLRIPEKGSYKESIRFSLGVWGLRGLGFRGLGV